MDIKECEVIIDRIYDETRSIIIRSEGHVNEGWEYYLKELEYALADVVIATDMSCFYALLALSRGQHIKDCKVNDITVYERDWRLKAIDDIMFRLEIGE